MVVRPAGLGYSAQGRIFNNVLYVRYVHLTKAKLIIRDKPILSSEGMLHENYDRKRSVGRKPQGVWRQDELTGGKPPVVK
jgi:hypothetical protein